MEKSPFNSPPVPLTMKQEMLYDVPPQIPCEVFGFSSASVLKVSETIGGLALRAPESLGPVAEYGTKAHMYAEDILSMSSLIKRVVEHEDLQPKDVRPHRAAIKNIARAENTKFRWAERATKFFSFFGINGPQRMLNKYVEKQFIKRAPEKIDKYVGIAKAKLGMFGSYFEELIESTSPYSATETAKPASRVEGDMQSKMLSPENNFTEKIKEYIPTIMKFLPPEVSNYLLRSVGTIQDVQLPKIIGWLEDATSDKKDVSDPKEDSDDWTKQKLNKRDGPNLRLLFTKWRLKRMKKKNR